MAFFSRFGQLRVQNVESLGLSRQINRVGLRSDCPSLARRVEIGQCLVDAFEDAALGVRDAS